jgi:segregation and condensation protein B
LDHGEVINEHVEVESGRERIREYFDDDISAAIEALLFAAPIPLSVSQLAKLVGRDKLLIPALIDKLNMQYAETGRSFRIERFNDSYRFYTLENYDKYIGRLADIPRPAKLSRAALEVLSIIAYRQPVVKSEIERIRGIDSDGVIRTLLERSLITVAGKSDAPGRPLLYKTTGEFLEFFGISDLALLPKPEIEITDPDIPKIITLARPPESPVSENPDEAE